MHPCEAAVVRNGSLLRIDSKLLVRGDVVQIRAGDTIPADCRLLDFSRDFRVDRSRVVQGVFPSVIEASKVATSDYAAMSSNMIFMGTVAVSGSAKGLVIRTGDRTLWGYTLHLAGKRGKS